MLYPPDPRTEEATLREAAMCQREGITINIFLVPSWSQTEEDILTKIDVSTTVEQGMTVHKIIERSKESDMIVIGGVERVIPGIVDIVKGVGNTRVNNYCTSLTICESILEPGTVVEHREYEDGSSMLGGSSP